jgi:hypothetical protein
MDLIKSLRIFYGSLEICCYPFQKVTFGMSAASFDDDIIFFFLLSAHNLTNVRHVMTLDEEARHRRDRRIPQLALVDPSVSPWVKVYCSRSQTAMITFTGLDYPSFSYL